MGKRLTKADIGYMAEGRARDQGMKDANWWLVVVLSIMGVLIAGLVAAYVSFLVGVVLILLAAFAPAYFGQRRLKKMAAGIYSELSTEWKEFIEQ